MPLRDIPMINADTTTLPASKRALNSWSITFFQPLVSQLRSKPLSVLRPVETQY